MILGEFSRRVGFAHQIPSPIGRTWWAKPTLHVPYSAFPRTLAMIVTHAAQPCFVGQNTATQNTATQTKPRTRRPWQPDKDAHLIFQWVKFEGQTQGWVAAQFGI